MSVRETIAAYVEQISKESGLSHSANLFESGVLTSLDVLSLVAFLEDTFAIEVSGDDVDMKAFGTIDGLVAMVTALQSKSV